MFFKVLNKKINKTVNNCKWKLYEWWTELMIIWCIASVFHTALYHYSAAFWEKVCLQSPASLSCFTLFFKINAIDQQQSFLKLAERYEPIKALLLRLNMIGKENWFLLDLYPLAFYCNPLFVTFHYTPSEATFFFFLFHSVDYASGILQVLPLFFLFLL